MREALLEGHAGRVGGIRHNAGEAAHLDRLGAALALGAVLRALVGRARLLAVAEAPNANVALRDLATPASLDAMESRRYEGQTLHEAGGRESEAQRAHGWSRSAFGRGPRRRGVDCGG